MCLPLPVFYHILFNVFIFLLPTACTHSANSCLKAVVFAVSSTWNCLFHIFVFIAVDVVSHHWDPSSEMKECFPYCAKCCQQAAGSPIWELPQPKSAASPKVMFHFWNNPHVMTGYCWGINACLPCPNAGQLWKDISATGSPVRLTRAHWGLCWDCTWLSFSFFPVLLPSSPFHVDPKCTP